MGKKNNGNAATGETAKNRQPAAVLPDNLEAVRTLGSGSMASVVLARDIELKRLVAVKILRDEFAGDKAARQRFEREAQAAARLLHANVPTVYSVGRLPDQSPYIAMQYIEGRNLEEVLTSSGAFDVVAATGILQQVATALACAHQQKIVHRDVKPANILMDDQEHVWLTDFGVAAIVTTGSEALTRLTRDGERFGDPSYMSPEQIRGEDLTAQSDVYSYGIVGFELLAGHGPFESPEIRDVSSAHIRRPPPKISDIKPDVPGWLSDLLFRCMAKNPNHRPTSKDLVNAFSAAADPASAAESGEKAGAFDSFLGELKQRRVYQAAATYAAAVFIVLQVADLVFPAFDESDNAYRALVIGLLAGFPVVVSLSWVFDWRAGRLVRTQDDDHMADGSGRKALKIAGFAVCVLGSIGIAIWLLAR